MKINKDTIDFFGSLCWDYRVSEEDIIAIVELGECNGLTRKNLLGRALKSRSWYEIKKILSPELLQEALSEDVLKTLFPKSLFFQDWLSIAQTHLVLSHKAPNLSVYFWGATHQQSRQHLLSVTKIILKVVSYSSLKKLDHKYQ